MSTEAINELKVLLDDAYDLADEILMGEDGKQGRIDHIEDTLSYTDDAIHALMRYEEGLVK